MADAEDIQPLVCDNGTGMVKVMHHSWHLFLSSIIMHLRVIKVLVILVTENEVLVTPFCVFLCV